MMQVTTVSQASDDDQSSVSGVFQWPQDPEQELTLGDRLIGFLVDGLVRWDAHHFLHIAQHGYTYESNLAFFPLYPLCVR